MKSLFVLRHAKSDWKASYQGDHERPLNARGRKAAARVGRFLARIDQTPDRILLSSALRTRETLERAAQAGEWAAPTETLEELYEATTLDALTCLRLHGGRSERLLLVGHQPWAGGLISSLTDGGTVHMVTAALVRIDVRLEDWSKLEAGQGEIAWMVTPKLLSAAE